MGKACRFDIRLISHEFYFQNSYFIFFFNYRIPQISISDRGNDNDGDTKLIQWLQSSNIDAETIERVN